MASTTSRGRNRKMNQNPTREWLDERKSQTLNSTEKISHLLNCPGLAANCACVSEIKNEINAVISRSADLRPYATDQRGIDFLNHRARRITGDSFLSPPLVRNFCTAANRIPVDTARHKSRRPWLSDLGIDIRFLRARVALMVRREKHH